MRTALSCCCGAIALVSCLCVNVPCLQDELLNVIYWWRQVSGVLLGIIIGLIPVTGFYGMVM